MSIILGFDVSNSSCSVAILREQDVLAYKEDLRPSMQAENLLVLIEQALRCANFDYSDIHYLAFTNGPGSFTGIRIGLAAAEGILMASKIKPVIISNFEMSYYRILQQIKYFDKAIILLNAYRKQLYYQKFNYNGVTEECGIIDLDVITDLFANHNNEKIVIAGSGIVEIYNTLHNLSNITILPRFTHIKAWTLCRYAAEKVKKGDFGKLEPLYIRPPDAKSGNV